MITTEYRFQLARTEEQIRSYRRLRRTTFCDEQGLFAGTDEDEWDLVAYPIVAIARRGGGSRD